MYIPNIVNNNFAYLELGKIYLVSVKLQNNWVLETKLKFIKVTQKGFNFLNEETNKCVFKNHFYCKNESMTFWIPKQIEIRKI
jgi:hypothetical protein